MPTSGVYVLLAALVAPSLVEAGIQPMSAHLFILYFGMMSMITPPVALAAFAAATITKDDPLRTGLAAMRIGWASFILPFVFVASPALLMSGTWGDIALTFVLTAIGIMSVTIGISAYWGRRLGLGLRLAFVVLGAFALPLGFLPAAEALHLPAALAAVAFAVWLMVRNKGRTLDSKIGKMGVRAAARE
jgi:TRAP-type uncharacterized transport system fused permease subunit